MVTDKCGSCLPAVSLSSQHVGKVLVWGKEDGNEEHTWPFLWARAGEGFSPEGENLPHPRTYDSRV